MGRASRPKPARLADKLKKIRLTLGLSQGELAIRLRLAAGGPSRSTIAGYELGKEPPLPTILAYAHLANVIVDVLIDDELDLPGQIPCARTRPRY